jgi:hypothetical protein
MSGESWSLVAAVVMFTIIASMVPLILAGQTLIYPIFQILPGVSVTLRVDAFSLIFALAASFLWILAVFYSAGYMRGLHEHAQTRFNACFALALFGAMGVAFADNLFTLYLFYEIVSIGTYPLVAHHQDREGYEGAKKYIVYLTTTAKGLILPAMILIYVLTGTLDFADNISTGILPEGASSVLVTVLYIFCILGFAKNGVMPFHGWLPGAMVAPTPVSALLHAVAVVKVGVFCTTRVMLYVFGVDIMDDLSLGIMTAYFVSFTILVASIIALSKDNLKARLAYSTVSQLSYIILGVALLTPGGGGRRPDPYHQPRLCQDHPLLLRRGNLCRRPQEEYFRDGGPGPGDALHLRGLRGGLAVDDRGPAGGRLRDQMVPADRLPGRRPDRHHPGAAGLDHAQRRLFRPHYLQGLFRQAPGRRNPARRDQGGAAEHGNSHPDRRHHFGDHRDLSGLHAPVRQNGNRGVAVRSAITVQPGLRLFARMSS